MIDVMSVLECFGVLAGIPDEERERYLPLCSAAATHIKNRLKSDDERLHQSCVFAAAALALYRYRLSALAADDTGAFRAGETAATRRGAESAEAARRIFENALADLAPVLEDRDFYFSDM